jgi:pyruvate-ferredoxin/flavodoxin oxidoreductase
LAPSPSARLSDQQSANFVACHQFSFLERYDMLATPNPARLPAEQHLRTQTKSGTLPSEVQQQIIDKKLRSTSSTPTKWPRDGHGRRINTIMQTCFFAISGVLPREQAIEEIKKSIKKTYGKRGEDVVAEELRGCRCHPGTSRSAKFRPPSPARLNAAPRAAEAPEFVRDTLGPMIAGEGDSLPVSAMPVDGTFPTGTTQWEKRNIALEIPSGIRMSASSAASAPWSARMPSSAPRLRTRALLADAPRHLQDGTMPSSRNSRAQVHPAGRP